MNRTALNQVMKAAMVVGIVLTLTGVTWAYPPAPNHEVYGMVRNEYGDPIMLTSAQITLTTADGVKLAAAIVPGLESGVNYRMTIPMDGGSTTAKYRPTALSPTVPFTLSTVIGGVTYLPMELAGAFAYLGDPAKSTRIDLTLGVDSDGDGLPDAWENDLINQLGGGLTLDDIRPNDDSDNDGLTNLAEYRAGTYAWDAVDGFLLTVVNRDPGADTDRVEFLAITGRSYILQKSSDLKTWTRIHFRVPSVSSNLKTFYSATDVRYLQVEVPRASDDPDLHFYYRAIVE